MRKEMKCEKGMSQKKAVKEAVWEKVEGGMIVE